MSYKITFRDKSEAIVATEVGEKLVAAMAAGKTPEFITLAGDVYRSGQIISVTKSNLAAANSNTPVLPQGPQYSCGPYSIQRAIHRIALQQHPKDWPQYVRDSAWRERTRLALRKKYPNKKWCDYKAGEHACQEAKEPAHA